MNYLNTFIPKGGPFHIYYIGGKMKRINKCLKCKKPIEFDYLCPECSARKERDRHIDQAIRRRYCNLCGNPIDIGEWHFRYWDWKRRINICHYCLEKILEKIKERNKNKVGKAI